MAQRFSCACRLVAIGIMWFFFRQSSRCSLQPASTFRRSPGTGRIHGTLSRAPVSADRCMAGCRAERKKLLCSDRYEYIVFGCTLGGADYDIRSASGASAGAAAQVITGSVSVLTLIRFSLISQRLKRDVVSDR